jgi:hypothetical protein
MRWFTLYVVPLLSLPLVAFAAGLGPVAQQGGPSGAPPLVLVGGTVVDLTAWGDSANDIQNAVVVIREGRISDAGSAAETAIPKGATVIDCAGKFILPGLIDGYSGINSQGAANAALYMGVTTVVARQDSERGAVDLFANPSPRIYPIDSIGTSDNWSRLARQPQWIAALREGVRPVELAPQQTARQIAATARLGTRVLLIGHNITAANAQWIISRAHETGLVTYGEFVSTPYRVGIAAGIDALPLMGQYELGVIPDELQRPLIDDPDGSASRTAYDYSERIPPSDLHLREYGRLLAAHHAALMPAFSLHYAELPGHRNLWKEPAAALLDSSRMYKPTDRSTGEINYPLPFWARRLPGPGQRWFEAGEQKKAGQAAMRLWRINQSLFSAQIHYLAASGADAMGAMPGISLHTELELFVRLGLSPREALAAATNNYALQFGWNELGLIAPGRRADILVVDGDPTANIWNARRISTLIFDGNVVNREALLYPRR